ncbi:glycosyltransferase family 2 protein [Sphingobacterium paludis]|uniref:Glycosyltransferase involved in cell wall biosynthesis n=1 Tax=Sphingobacterium paludis TaxID=1476465 RepID=A0A4R7D4A3_9SPHI|nr:glycosyltransferase family 2 protein [Sphingobacterium paludis]TDS13696.1 glycosyltransferase involved in cell wall biosynthesis [Sphingobacterium paludis]
MNEISVALCTYNGGRYLRKQLVSIVNQSYPVSEIIIVDDCSSDDTISVIEEFMAKYKFIKLYVNERNMGSNQSFRKAISLTNNDFIALCDQDDIWMTSKLESQIKEMCKIPDFSTPTVIFHDSLVIDSHDNVIAPSFLKIRGLRPTAVTFRSILLNNIVTGCTCLINRGMKDAVLKSNMDRIIMHDYLIALIAYGFGKAIYLDEKLMSYRSHSASVTEKNVITLRSRAKDFVNRIRNNSYLTPMIEQGISFQKDYGKYVFGGNVKVLNNFVSLRNASLLKKICYRWSLI